MSTFTEHKGTARYIDGHIVVEIGGEVELRFPVSGNPGLASARVDDLNRIEVSPFGLHWPTLDEDLSFRGLLRGDYGQRKAG